MKRKKYKWVTLSDKKEGIDHIYLNNHKIEFPQLERAQAQRFKEDNDEDWAYYWKSELK